MEVSGMDSTDLRLLFVIGLVGLAIGIVLFAWAVDRLVTSWRTYRETAIKRATGNAPVAPRRAPLPDRRLLVKQARWRLLL
jgi:hypothetical protein